MKVILYKCKINVSAVAQWQIWGRGPGGLLPAPLFLAQTEAQRAEKIFLGECPPPAFSQGLDDHPSYLSDPPLKWSHFMSYDTFNYNMAIK